jgi:hypothetical protein
MFMSQQLRKTFPHVPIYPAIGNNDSYGGDYYNHPNGAFYKFLIKNAAWGQFFLKKNNKIQFKTIFPFAGYYAVTPPHAFNNKLLILNTVLFSSYAKGQPNVAAASRKELNLLTNHLKKAKRNKYKVLLILHIPSGIDLYATLKNGHHISMLWTTKTRMRFQAILNSYASVISGIIGGHLHRDTFILYHLAKTTLPVIITPSFLPAFGHSSEYKDYNYSPGGLRLESFSVYYFHQSRWLKAYNLNEQYQSYCNNCIQALTQNTALAKRYQYEYARFLYKTEHLKEKNWSYAWCAINHLDSKQFSLSTKY